MAPKDVFRKPAVFSELSHSRRSRPKMLNSKGFSPHGPWQLFDAALSRTDSMAGVQTPRAQTR
jgi:hypothetical protein